MTYVYFWRKSSAFDDALGVAAVNGWNWLTFVAGLTVILIVVGLAANYILIED